MSGSQLRGQRISRTNLICESRETLQRFGVGNHSRAAFVRKVASEVVGSKASIFIPLQPKFLDHATDAWESAFWVALDFLKRRKMSLTLETIRVEAGDEFLGEGKHFSLATLLSKRPPLLSFTERVLQSQFGDAQFADPRLRQGESRQQSPKHSPDSTALAKKTGAVSPGAGGGKPDFTTPFGDGTDDERDLGDTEEEFSSDFHIDEVLHTRK
jgi:hypothetical protein